MPEISRFFGIVVYMYFDDHAPPHFHAKYNDENVVIGIDSLDVLEGKMRSRGLKLIREWAKLHQEELRDAWKEASEFRTPRNIEPLF
jgi:hypothetical protein